MSVRLLFALFLLSATGCATGMRSRLPLDAQCYGASSIIWPLGADSSRTSGSGSWLILLSQPFSDSTRRLKAYAVDTFANTYGGSWESLGGDTVVADLWDVFTSTRLRLVQSHDLLVGRAHGTSDEMKDSSGVSVPLTADWFARFRHLGCQAIPDSLLRYVDAA